MVIVFVVFIPPGANAIIIKQQRIHSVTRMWATLTTGVLKQYSPTSISMWHLQHLLLEVVKVRNEDDHSPKRLNHSYRTALITQPGIYSTKLEECFFISQTVDDKQRPNTLQKPQHFLQNMWQSLLQQSKSQSKRVE